MRFLQSLLVLAFVSTACGPALQPGKLPGKVIEPPQAGLDGVTVEAAVGDHLLLRSASIPLHPDFLDAKTTVELDPALLKLIGDQFDSKSFGATIRIYELELLAAPPADVRIVTRASKVPGERVTLYHVIAKAR